MSEQKKKAYGLPSVQAREANALPIDISNQDTYLALITKATEWKKGGGFMLHLTLYNPDGSYVVPKISGKEKFEIQASVPLTGPKWTTSTKAIFPEADAGLAEGFDLEDTFERWVYAKLERDKKRDENPQELEQWGPRLQVAAIFPIPVPERYMIRKLHETMFQKPSKQFANATPPGTNPTPAAGAAAPAAKPASVPAGAVPAGIDPNDPFGTGQGK